MSIFKSLNKQTKIIKSFYKNYYSMKEIKGEIMGLGAALDGMATLLWTFIIKSFDSIALVTDNSKMSVISYY